MDVDPRKRVRTVSMQIQYEPASSRPAPYVSQSDETQTEQVDARSPRQCCATVSISRAVATGTMGFSVFSSIPLEWN